MKIPSNFKAVGLLVKQASDDLSLSAEGVRVLRDAHSFYHKFSHPTVLALADTIDLGGGGHYLGASFDERKLIFHKKELASRIGFAGVLPNSMEGIAIRMRRWPLFTGTAT